MIKDFEVVLTLRDVQRKRSPKPVGMLSLSGGVRERAVERARTKVFENAFGGTGCRVMSQDAILLIFKLFALHWNNQPGLDWAYCSTLAHKDNHLVAKWT
jgi:hypothetical protein